MKYFVASFLFSCITAMSAADFFSAPDAPDAINAWFIEQVGIASDDQGKCFYLKRPEGAVMPGNRAATKKMLEVDPNKRYAFSGSFKLSNAGDDARVYFGYLAFDKNSRRLRVCSKMNYYEKLCGSVLVLSSSKEKVPVQWTSYSGIARPLEGTKYIVPYIYYYSKKYRDSKMYFKNIKVVEL